MFKPLNKKIGKGEYLVWIEHNDDGTSDVYSTDSVFWRDFFQGK